MKRYLNGLLTFAFLASPALAHADEAQGGEGGGLLKVLGIEWQGVLVQICGFAILFFLLRKYLFGPLQSALAARRAEIQTTYDRLDDQQRQVKTQLADLEQRLAGVETERREVIQRAGQEAKALQDQILAEARQQAERTLEQGRRAMQVEQQKAIATLREEMADLAVRAAGQLLSEELNDERHRRLVTDFISQVGS